MMGIQVQLNSTNKTESIEKKLNEKTDVHQISKKRLTKNNLQRHYV